MVTSAPHSAPNEGSSYGQPGKRDCPYVPGVIIRNAAVLCQRLHGITIFRQITKHNAAQKSAVAYVSGGLHFGNWFLDLL